MGCLLLMLVVPKSVSTWNITVKHRKVLGQFRMCSLTTSVLSYETLCSARTFSPNLVHVIKNVTPIKRGGGDQWGVGCSQKHYGIWFSEPFLYNGQPQTNVCEMARGTHRQAGAGPWRPGHGQTMVPHLPGSSLGCLAQLRKNIFGDLQDDAS